MKTTHRLATGVAAAAAVAAAVVAPTPGEASYPTTAQPTATVEAAMSSSMHVRQVRTRRLFVRTAAVVTVGDELVVRGRTTLRRARVLLQVKHSGRWRRLDRTRTSARGTFRVGEAVKREGTHRFRVVVSPRSGHDATARFRIKVVPRSTVPTSSPTEVPTDGTSPTPRPVATSTPTPTASTPTVAPTTPTPTAGAGDPDDWSYITGGTDPIAWNSCSPITWSYQSAGGYSGAQADWERAFALVAERSGLTFEQTATAGAINVSWSDAATHPELSGGVVGFGGPSYRLIDPASNGGVRMLIIGGRVVLDREAPISPGHATSGRAGWGQVMVHELMHAVGLGHAAGREQIMYPSTGTLAMGAGDHTGLRNVGSTRGCLSTKQYDASSPSADGGADGLADGGGRVVVHDRLRDIS